MSKIKRFSPLTNLSLAVIPMLALSVAGCTEAEKTHEEIIREDLLIIIDELGSPCGRVVDHQVTAELAYSVKCESGHVYSISVSSEGRVTIE